uniref:uncharacterized protein LOC124064190 n=1 Tax=Scatophagus argus TaxID=75038 RepID=UPI001ED836C6|nr:uncharacterized protein LOC124064190 [Scatophagus argus]
MWSMRVIILHLFYCACLSTKTGSVYFISRNFNNTLHWDAANPAFPGENVNYMYSVQYKSDAKGQSFQMKEGCQNITALSCDLTAETPSLPDVHYWAKVFVNGLFYNYTRVRFKPFADTILGPPTLSIKTTVSSLYVNVNLPLGPNGVSIADIITKSKNGPVKTSIIYTLKITHPKWAEVTCENSTGKFVINLKNNKTNYSGYVFYTPNSERGRPESEKAYFSVTLPDDPLMFLPWFIAAAALLVVIVIISVVCMCIYVNGGKTKSIPHKLVTTSSIPPSVLQSLDSDIIISKPEFCSQSEKTVYAQIRTKPTVSSAGVGGYSPQDTPCQAWQDTSGSSVDTGAHSSAPIPEDTSAQSSENYGAVVAHVPTEEKDFQQATIKDRATSNTPLISSGGSWDKGGISPKLTSHGVPPIHNPGPFDNPNRPILLHAVRDSNGQLILPSLIFQLESSTGDTQRKPLLSDLIDSQGEGPSLASLQSLDGSEWSDSECDNSTLNTPTQLYCNTHYSPSQPVAPDSWPGCQNTPSNGDISESDYKQNWISAICLENKVKYHCEYRKTNCQWTWADPKREEEREEEEDRGGEEGSRPILLGDWAVKIQE